MKKAAFHIVTGFCIALCVIIGLVWLGLVAWATWATFGPMIACGLAAAAIVSAVSVYNAVNPGKSEELEDADKVTVTFDKEKGAVFHYGPSSRKRRRKRFLQGCYGGGSTS